jgi:hypothetical protein
MNKHIITFLLYILFILLLFIVIKFIWIWTDNWNIYELILGLFFCIVLYINIDILQKDQQKQKS